jgi:hypothetical protein
MLAVQRRKFRVESGTEKSSVDVAKLAMGMGPLPPVFCKR